MKDLHIVVCLRQVPDPNGFRAGIAIDTETKKIALSGIPPVINPFDENALEAAIRLKETHGGKVTALAVGEFLSKAVMMKALAVGADDLILYEDKRFSGMDSLSTARALSHAIKRVGEFSIIMTGLQTSDWGFGLLGAQLAHFLNIPFIGMAQKVSVDSDDSHVVVKRATRNSHQVIKAAMPAVITADSLVGELRYPSLKALVLAKKRPIDKWNFGDFEIDAMGPDIGRLSYEIEQPPDRKRNCFMITGESEEEKGKNLAGKLGKEGVLSGEARG